MKGVEASWIPEAPWVICSPTHMDDLIQFRHLIRWPIDGSTYKTMQIKLVGYISASLLGRSKVNIGVVERHRVSATW